MRLLQIREVAQYALDDPRRTLAHKEVISRKPFLKNLYLEWYRYIAKELPPEANTVIELGSGGGSIKEVLPKVITSDVVQFSGIDQVFDATEMPFDNSSVDAVLLLDVFHHVSDSEKLLREISRVLKPGGRIIMNEPCNSVWSRVVYKNFHHEDFDVQGGWSMHAQGPLSTANMAQCHIVFERDCKLFEEKFPEFKLVKNRLHTPFRYLLSGGVSMKQLVPNWSFGLFKSIEKLLEPFSKVFSMFQLIVIEKRI